MKESPGIIYNKQIQVKMLILFVMSRLTHPITQQQLTELALCDERLSYFDVTECIPKLIKSKQLQETDGKYTLTAKGLLNSETLEEELLSSVRIKAEEALKRINEILAREDLIKTSSGSDENGVLHTKLSLSDGIGSILSIELIAANNEQAEALEKGFRRNSRTIYKDIVKAITK